jgi:RNA polymerase sigma-70 factor, ECF subfamily
MNEREVSAPRAPMEPSCVRQAMTPADLQMHVAFRAGRAAWPRVELHFEDFQRRAAELSEQAETGWLKHSADFYLCCACAGHSREAILALEEQLLPRVTTSIARVCTDLAFVEEVLQCLRHKLLVGAEPKITMYRAQGPLIAWLNSMAVHLALDARRSRQAEWRKSTLPNDDVSPEPAADDWLIVKRYAGSFQEALSLAVASLTPQQREVLQLRVCGGQSIDHMGTRYGVHRATAARWLQDARRRIALHVQSEIERRHGLSETEFHGVAQHVWGLLAFDFSSELPTSVRSRAGWPGTGGPQPMSDPL